MLRRGGSADHSGTDPLRQLDDRDSDASARGVHEHGLALAQSTHDDDQLVGGQIVHRDRGSLLQRHPRGPAVDLGLGYADHVGVASKARKGKDVLPDPARIHPVPDRVDPACDFVPRDDRHGRQIVIHPHAPHHVRKVDACRCDANPHLCGARQGIPLFAKFEHLRRSRLRDPDLTHGGVPPCGGPDARLSTHAPVREYHRAKDAVRASPEARVVEGGPGEQRFRDPPFPDRSKRPKPHERRTLHAIGVDTRPPGSYPGDAMDDATPRPYVPASASMTELTLRGLVVGSLLGICFAASSVYLGLKIGLTVSASIPIAVLSITLFRAFGRATILENNIVQTTGSAGESIAAGVAFTLPSLLLMGFDLDVVRVTLVAL